MANTYQKLTSEVDVNISPTVTSPATGFLANSKYPFAFTPDPELPSVVTNYLESYANEAIKLKSVFAPTTPAPDGYIKFRVDGIEQGIVLGLMSLTVPSLQHPIVYKNPLVAGPNSRIEMYYVPIASTTVLTTVTMSITFSRIPARGIGR